MQGTRTQSSAPEARPRDALGCGAHNRGTQPGHELVTPARGSEQHSTSHRLALDGQPPPHAGPAVRLRAPAGVGGSGNTSL